jgi:nicotinamide-nucleotide amidase
MGKSLVFIKQETYFLLKNKVGNNALYMARNVALINNTDVGISTTGIAGPGNDSTGKPVGLVYIGLYIRGKEYSQELNLFGNRNKIREMTTLYALDYLRKKL